MSGRAFTIDEANALIPELEEVLAGIQRRVAELQRHQDKIQVLDALWGEKLQQPDTPDHREFLEHRAGLERAAAEIQRAIKDDIVARGIRFPQGGIEHGLLDFPTTLDGRWVYLCWRSGEPRVEAWHEVDGGFAGRRPITEDEARRMGE